MGTSSSYQRSGIFDKAGSFPQHDPLRRRYTGSVGLNGVVHEADSFEKFARPQRACAYYNESPHRRPRRLRDCPTFDVRTRLGPIVLFGPSRAGAAAAGR